MPNTVDMQNHGVQAANERFANGRVVQNFVLSHLHWVLTCFARSDGGSI
jgi:hypothetical protein